MKPLTIFSGPNSSGKSAVIKSLLMVAQSLGSSAREVPLVLNGQYTQLGGFDHILHHGSDPPEIELRFVIKRQKKDIDVWASIKKDKGPTSMRVTDSTVSWGDSDEESFELTYEYLQLSEIEKRRSIQIAQEQIDQGLFDYKIVKPRVTSSLGPEETLSASLSNFLPGRTLVRVTSATRKLAEDLEAVYIGLLSIVEFEPSMEELLSAVHTEDVDVDRKLGEGVQRVFGLIRPAVWWSDNFRSTVEHISESKIVWTIGQLQRYVQGHLQDGEIKDLVRRMNSILPEAAFSLRQARARTRSAETEFETRELPPQYSQIIQQIRRVLGSQTYYLGPLRDDPRTIYAIPPLPNQRDVGLKGEYTAAMLDIHKELKIKYPQPPSEEEEFDGEYKYVEKGDLSAAVRVWLERMGLAENFDITMTAKVGYQLAVRPKGVKQDLDLMSLGVGVSQVLPTIVMALLAPEDSVLNI